LWPSYNPFLGVSNSGTVLDILDGQITTTEFPMLRSMNARRLMQPETAVNLPFILFGFFLPHRSASSLIERLCSVRVP
jgi:hypothetical protein